jgi:Peptidase M50B-like
MAKRLNIRRLAWLAAIALVSVLFWLSPVLAPFKIFVVFIHETGHALATLLTGGRVLSMVVTPWQSGYVESLGGNALLIASAGYIGSALFGGIMLSLSGRKQWTQCIFIALAILFGVMTLCFVRNLFGWIFGLGTTAIFSLLAYKRFPFAVYMVDILAVMSSMYAIYDLSDFLLVGARTDAVMLASITGVPAFIWALVWSAISSLVVYGAGKRALMRP